MKALLENSQNDNNFTLKEAINEAKRCLNCSKPLCRIGCPIENEIPAFIKELANGNIGQASAVIARHSNLPAVCGRVCAHEKQCEGSCVLSKTGTGIKIGKLERFIADLDADLEITPLPKNTNMKGNVAIIGSGPAGLTVAGDLAKLGFAITVFDAQAEPGGVLMYGIPAFRLCKDVVRREIQKIQRLGVTFKNNVLIGRDLSLDQLFNQGFDAIFIGTGNSISRRLDIEGSNLAGILQAKYLLQIVALANQHSVGQEEIPIVKGDTVIVIGAGNVAMDAARTALRIGAASVTVLHREAANDVDEQDQDAGDGVAAHELAGTVHGAEEVGFLGHFLAPLAGLGFADQAGVEVGVDRHLLARHRVKREARGDFGDPAGAFGDHNEVDDGQNHEADDADSHVAADQRTPRWWALCITSPGDAQQRATVRALGREVLAAFPQLAAFIHEERATADAFAFGEKRVQTLDASGNENPGAARLFQPLNGSFFALDAASFFQVNTAAAQVLARTARNMLRPMADADAGAMPRRGLLDLYCGVGAPGLLLAGNYAALLGLEQDSKAVKLAKINAARHGQGHCLYEAGDAALRLEKLADSDAQEMWATIREAGHGAHGEQAPDSYEAELDARKGQIHPTVTDALVDPPRAGLSPRALDALLRIAPERILYISCNPATMARDAAQISKHYRLQELAAVDLFPHTPHIECVSLWCKG